MTFLLRAAFWTAVVAVLVPGPPHGAGHAAGRQAFETLKTDAILRLARVRAELNDRDSRAPKRRSP
jgi:hypothetical protein